MSIDKNFPFGFSLYGEEWLMCYKIIKRSSEINPYSSLRYYLLCRVIEIYLKAYLLIKGVELKELRKKYYGHNINNLFNKAIKLGLDKICNVSKGDAIVVKMLSPYYTEKEFEYMAEGMQYLPKLEVVEQLADKLCKKVGVFAEKFLY